MAYIKDPEIRKAPPDVIERRRERFERLNAIVTQAGGWITSTPGHRDVVVECVPESRLPNLLADRGYDLTPEPDGERILPSAIVETVSIEGSSGTRRIVHAGIVKTKRFSFSIS